MKVGERWWILFLDHVEEGKKLALTELTGIITKTVKNGFVISVWDIKNYDNETIEGNQKIFTIANSTVLEKRKQSSYKNLIKKHVKDYE
jgi:hypothetical protein